MPPTEDELEKLLYIPESYRDVVFNALLIARNEGVSGEHSLPESTKEERKLLKLEGSNVELAELVHHEPEAFFIFEAQNGFVALLLDEQLFDLEVSETSIKVNATWPHIHFENEEGWKAWRGAFWAKKITDMWSLILKALDGISLWRVALFVFVVVLIAVGFVAWWRYYYPECKYRDIYDRPIDELRKACFETPRFIPYNKEKCKKAATTPVRDHKIAHRSCQNVGDYIYFHNDFGKYHNQCLNNNFIDCVYAGMAYQMRSRREPEKREKDEKTSLNYFHYACKNGVKLGCFYITYMNVYGQNPDFEKSEFSYKRKNIKEARRILKRLKQGTFWSEFGMAIAQYEGINTNDFNKQYAKPYKKVEVDLIDLQELKEKGVTSCGGEAFDFRAWDESVEAWTTDEFEEGDVLNLTEIQSCVLLEDPSVEIEEVWFESVPDEILYIQAKQTENKQALRVSGYCKLGDVRCEAMNKQVTVAIKYKQRRDYDHVATLFVCGSDHPYCKNPEDHDVEQRDAWLTDKFFKDGVDDCHIHQRIPAPSEYQYRSIERLDILKDEVLEGGGEITISTLEPHQPHNVKICGHARKGVLTRRKLTVGVIYNDD